MWAISGPPIPPDITPLISCSSHGEGSGVRGACTWFTCCRSYATCSCRSLFCCCNWALIASNWSLLWRTLHICSSISVTLCECEHILQMFIKGLNLAILVLLNICLQWLQWNVHFPICFHAKIMQFGFEICWGLKICSL